MNDDMDSVLRVPFRFRRRPAPIPGDLRPEWRIAMIVLILDHFRGGRATMRQLHVLNWAIRSAESRAIFHEALNGPPRDLGRPIFRVEPSLNRAIDLALGYKLVERNKDKLSLTKSGKSYANDLQKARDVLTVERQFLDDLGEKITAQMIDLVLKWNDV